MIMKVMVAGDKGHCTGAGISATLHENSAVKGISGPGAVGELPIWTYTIEGLVKPCNITG